MTNSPKGSTDDTEVPPLRSFVDRHAPRHPANRGFAQLHAPVMTLGPRREEVSQPKTLVDFYLGGDFARLYVDLCSRPDHYTERQATIIRAQYMKQPCFPEPEISEVNSLVFQLTRSTDMEAKHKKILEGLKQEKPFDIGDDAELLDGNNQTLSTFEDQDFDDLIPVL